jgi:zinc finger protein
MSLNAEYNCPVCKKGELTLNQTTYDVPYFGPLAILTTRCLACGFKHNDVIPLKAQQPTCYIAKITEKDDLKIRLIRSSTATVRIPELGVEVTPGPLAEGFVSNIEGLIERTENIVKSILALTKNEKKRIKQTDLLKKLNLAREGNLPFTVIIKDPMGNSAMVSEKKGKVRCRKLSKNEIKSLKPLGILDFK